MEQQRKLRCENIKNKKVTELTESIMERLEVRDSFGVSYFLHTFRLLRRPHLRIPV